MRLSPLAWQSLTPQHTFSDTAQAVHFFDFQTEAKQALDQFKRRACGSLLVMKTETFPEYIQAIEDDLIQSTTQSVCTQIHFDSQMLFGYQVFLDKENRIQTVDGLLAKTEPQTIVLSIKALLSDIAQWDKLKQALLLGEYTPLALTPIPQKILPIKTAFKLLLVGSREDIAALFQYDDSLYHFGEYSEIHNYLTVDANNIQQWGDYVQTLAKRYTEQSFTPLALSEFFAQYARESESQDLVTISPTKIKKDVTSLANYFENLTACQSISAYFRYQEKQAAQLNQFALNDMLTDQLHIETEGEKIGQINGLSVIEFDGVPTAFGEPLRISCQVRFGDGEITDIERKVELGGHLHAKGILLAESCLMNLLELPTQLPFSASLAFEQSYGEVDGDSSALAIFCVLVSALAKLPLPQSIALTGAIDQFGRVQSVGGVNQKIEGFFQLCQSRGLTGTQGVLIPKSCLSHLSLKSELIEAVKAKQFYLWAVEDVFEACELLFGLPFFEAESDEEQDTLAKRIQQELAAHPDEEHASIWSRLFGIFLKRNSSD